MPEPTQTLGPTATAEPVEPLFSQGYARVDGNTAVYSSASMGTRMGTLTGSCIVYVYAREETGDPGNDPVAIAFATATGVVTGYVRARHGEALDDEAALSYAGGLRTGHAWAGEYPLEEVGYEPAETRTPEPSETVEETAEPAEETPEESPETLTPEPEETPEATASASEEPAQTEKPVETPCSCDDETGQRLCPEDCPCACHQAEAQPPAEDLPQAAVPMELSIEIYAQPNPVIIGQQVTLYAVPEHIASALWQWQYSVDGLEWIDIPGANELTYTFVSDQVNIAWYYRMLALEPVAEAPAAPEQPSQSEPPSELEQLSEPGPEQPSEPEQPAEPQAESQPSEPEPQQSAEPDPPSEPQPPEASLLTRLTALLFPVALAESGVSVPTVDFVASSPLTLGSLGSPVAVIVETGDPFATLADAVTAAVNGQTIQILDNIILSGSITIGKSLTLTTDGAKSITRGAFAGPMLTVSGSLSLRDSLTLDGGSGDGVILSVATGGMLRMGIGVILTGGSGTNGGGVYVSSGGAFAMTGGTITGNTAANGGGVYVASDGAFAMTGGTITGNTAVNGGGVYVQGGFTLYGGSINGNISSSGVHVASGDASLAVSGGADVSDPVWLDDGQAVSVTDSGPNAFYGSMLLDPNTYTAGRTVLTHASGTFSALTLAHFTLTEPGWLIDGEGKLRLDAVASVTVGGVTTGYMTLEEAITAANTAGTATVTVHKNVTLATAPTIIAGSDITLLSDAPVTISGCQLIVSGTLTLGGNGGALTLNGAGIFSSVIRVDGTLDLYDGVTITGNTAATGGGGVHNASGTFNMYGGLISDNICESHGGGGGGVHNASGTFNMYGGSISGNEDRGSGGGGVYNAGTFNLYNGRISGNHTWNSGGGVFNASTGTFNMSGGEISGNYSALAIDVAFGLCNLGDFDMSGGRIFGNEQAVDTEGVVFSSGTFTLSGGAVIEDTVYQQSGAAFITVGDGFAGSARVKPFTYHVSPPPAQQVLTPPTGEPYSPDILARFGIVPNGTGGWGLNDQGELISTDVASVTPEGGTPTGYPTLADAMAAANAAGDATVTLLADAHLDATATVAVDNSITLQASGSRTITRASTHSGPMLDVIGTLTLRGGGGSLRIDGKRIEDSTNHANHVVKVEEYGALTLDSGVTLTGGNAQYGGGVYTLASSTFWMKGGTISGNTAIFNGGGVCSLASSFEIDNGTISGNTAGNGGGVSVQRDRAQINGGSFTNNIADTQGGGVFLYENTALVVNDGSFTNNIAGNQGGGVFLCRGTSLEVNGGSFTNNTAGNGGGGIYADTGAASITLNTDGLFADSTLYFEKQPVIQKPVKLALTGSVLGALPVEVRNPDWLSEGQYAWAGTAGYTLRKISTPGGGAMQVWRSTATVPSLPNTPYGQALAPAATVLLGTVTIPGATAAFTYATTETGSYSPTPPTNAGSYWVKASYAGNDTALYAPSEGTAPFSITPATPAVTLRAKTAPYSGSAVSIDPATVTGVPGREAPTGAVSYTYYADAAPTTPLSGPPRDAGVYRVTATVAAAGNYGTATSGVAQLTVTSATPAVALRDKTAAYTGRAVSIGPATVTGIPGGAAPTGAVTYAYSVNPGMSPLLSGPPTNAGVYYGQATLAAHGNYTSATSGVAQLTITPVIPTVTLTDKAVTYTGSAVSIGPATVTVIPGGAAPTGAVTYAYSANAGMSPLLSGPPVDVGVYYGQANLAAHGNYMSAASGVARLTITQATPTVILPNKRAPYTGKAISIGPATVVGAGGAVIPATVTYAYYSNAACTRLLSGPPVDTGTYYVKATAAAQPNYTAATSAAARLVITDPDPTQIITVNGRRLELLLGPVLSLTINGRNYGCRMVNEAQQPRPYLPWLEVAEEEDGSLRVTLFVEALPETDVLGHVLRDASGNPLFERRLLILDPERVDALLALGITDICLILEDAALRVPISSFRDEAVVQAAIAGGAAFSQAGFVLDLQPANPQGEEQGLAANATALSRWYRACASLSAGGESLPILPLLPVAELLIFPQGTPANGSFDLLCLAADPQNPQTVLSLRQPAAYVPATEWTRAFFHAPATACGLYALALPF